ncbi:MAG: hypothetical protein ACTSXT_16430 [Candidatus Helarchaeota archaeon]
MGSDPTRKAIRYAALCSSYLKFNELSLTETKTLNLKKMDFLLEVKIKKENSFLKQLSFIDIIGSNTKAEYYFECKFSESNNEIGINSSEFKDALLEFINLKNYVQYNHRSEIGYILLTTKKISKLKEERNRLINSSFQHIQEYLTNLNDYRNNKWANSLKVSDINYFKQIINGVIIYQLELPRLEESLKNQDIKAYFNEVLDEYHERNPHSNPFIILQNYDFLMDNLNDDSQLCFDVINGHKYVLNLNSIREIEYFINDIKNKNIIKKAIRNISQNITLFFNDKIPQYDLISSTSKLINDNMVNADSFIIMIPYDKTIYIINKTWFDAIVEKNMSYNHNYNVSAIMEDMNLKTSKNLAKIAITEYRRLNGTYLDPSFFK